MRIIILSLLFACTHEEPRVQGKVVDIWGQPLVGATVIVVGQHERPTTDAEGRYWVPRDEGSWEVKAGAEGYVPAFGAFEIKPDTTMIDTLQLWPKPDESGFFLVGPGRYDPLQPQPVVSKGNTLKTYRGLEAVGETTHRGPNLRVLFHTELKQDQINRLGLELTSLDFIREAEIPAAVTSKVELNLYVAGKARPIKVTPLPSRTDYLLEVEQLEAGTYALHTQDILDNMPSDVFEQLPKEHRLAWGFHVAR